MMPEVQFWVTGERNKLQDECAVPVTEKMYARGKKVQLSIAL